MKKLLILCIVAVMSIAASIRVFGQNKKDGSKNKQPQFLKVDSLRPQTQSSYQDMYFRKESEDEIITPSYVLNNNFISKGSVRMPYMKFLSHSLDTPWGAITFNLYQVHWYPIFFSN